MNTEQIVINVQAIRIDGKKLTTSVLEQFKIHSLFDYIVKNELWEFDFNTHNIRYICRISSVPILKLYRSHLSRTHQDKYVVDGIMSDYDKVEEFGAWSVDGEVYLHPIGKAPRYGHDPSWNEIIDTFNHAFKDAPKALYSV